MRALGEGKEHDSPGIAVALFFAAALLTAGGTLVAFVGRELA